MSIRPKVTIWSLINKLCKASVDWVLILFSIPLVFIFRAIKPFLLIRFGYFFVDRIGHFAFDVEYYLCNRKQKEQETPTLDYFFFVGNPCNSSLEGLVRRKIRVHRGVEILYRANKTIPFGSSHAVRPAREINQSRDIDQLFRRTDRQLDFSSAETRFGTDYLRRMGCREGDQFVCLFVRDGAYLSQVSDRDYSYHKYRDSDIENYKKGAVALAKKGYWVFRMGKIVESEFNLDNPKIINYSSSQERSDLLDIWLMAHCQFAISSSAGLDAVSEVFRLPIVFLNHLPVGNLKTGNSQHIELFKTLRWEKTKLRLSLKEQIEIGAIYFESSQRYQAAGIEIEDNSEDEIMETILEMEARVKGDWVSEPTDEILQDKFYSILQEWDQFHIYHGVQRSRIATKFLRENHAWFLN